MPSNYVSVQGTVEYQGLEYSFEAGVIKIVDNDYGSDADGNRGMPMTSYELEEITLLEDPNGFIIEESPELKQEIDRAISKGDFQEL